MNVYVCGCNYSRVRIKDLKKERKEKEGIKFIDNKNAQQKFQGSSIWISENKVSKKNK